MQKSQILIPIFAAILLSSCTQVNPTNVKLEDPTPINSEPTQNQITNIINQKESTMSANQTPELKNQTITMETSFGTLNIKMLDDIAPKATENFIRLSAKGYYDGTKFHRIVKSSSFSIIQGGDPTATGRGGASIWDKEFEDETFDASNNLPEIYGEFNGQYCVYKKGLIAMANAGPNTNGSQFFVMIGDTKLPPNYTIFGQVNETDFPVLDKISKEVSTDNPTGDGMPNQEIKIISASIKK